MNDGWSCGYEFHRIFSDSGNDIAYVLSNTGDPGDSATGDAAHPPTFYVQFSGAAKPNELSGCTSSSCSQTLALSVGMAGQSKAATDDYNACINAASRTIAADDTLTCSATGTTIGSGSGTGVVELSRQYLAATSANLLNSSASTTLSFTGASDFFTAATTQ
jgi:hypothetical protein